MNNQFNKLAKLYNQNDQKEMAFNIYLERPSILEAIGEVKNLNILDLGTSAGHISHSLFLKKADAIIGMDSSEIMIDFAKKRNKGFNYMGIVKDINEGFDLGSEIDLIFSSLTFHYIKDWSKVLDSVFKYLKKNGKFVLQIQSPTWFENNFSQKELKEKINDKWEKNNQTFSLSMYYKSQEEIIKTFNKHGFKIIKNYYSKPHGYLKKVDSKLFNRLQKEKFFEIFVVVKK